jgi:hypothetical protein
MAVLTVQPWERAGARCASLLAYAALAIAALAFVIGVPQAARAQSAASEAAVKAAFVYNFAKFTEWPQAAFASPQAPLVLCVPANLEASLGQAFAGVDAKTAQARSIRLRRIGRGDDLGGCHIVYLNESDSRRNADALRALAGRPVLSVSDAEGFAEAGGMIGLVYVDNRIQFEINVEATQQAGLSLSSQLLRLARIVRDNRTKERK